MYYAITYVPIFASFSLSLSLSLSLCPHPSPQVLAEMQAIPAAVRMITVRECLLCAFVTSSAQNLRTAVRTSMKYARLMVRKLKFNTTSSLSHAFFAYLLN